MKKTSKNLVLRSETLRTLVRLDLAHVAGGVESGTQSGAFQCPKLESGTQSGAFQCPNAIVVESGELQCTNR
jgi:hypothetical protein